MLEQNIILLDEQKMQLLGKRLFPTHQTSEAYRSNTLTFYFPSIRR